MITENRVDIIDNEVLIVRNSGEIPEIALYASLYYLKDEPEGPGIVVTEEELCAFQAAALVRSREIILRDLDPDNRDLALYRGLKRTIANYRRHHDFLARIGRKDDEIKGITARALLQLLNREVKEVGSGRRVSSINCTISELVNFIDVLEVSRNLLPYGWQKLCSSGNCED